MPIYRADAALLPDGIARNVLIAVERDRIGRVEVGAPAAEGEVRLSGLVLPGMANVHSHAFQRAMAGLAEWDGGGEDNFWSWREAMYRFAERLDPDSQHAIALFLYIEMLKAGYTAVGEFHYLHNRPDGSAYAPPTAMADALVSAARDAGIALALLPTLYMQGGVDGRPLSQRQRRFGKTVDDLLSLRESFQRNSGVASLGLAIHSLRAVPSEAIRDAVSGIGVEAPLHIHVAEQIGEIAETIAAYGKRPVQYLLDNFEIGPRWCFVHSTHMDEDETRRFARSGGVAGLCPTTEGNLGDGIFPLTSFLEAEGKIAIGGDSHVGVDPAEELRMMDYVQRLALRRRNVSATLKQPHTAARLWSASSRGGAQALALGAGEIVEGARADLIVFDPAHPSFAGRDPVQTLDTYVFVAGRDAVRDVMVGGNWVIKNHHHALEEQAAVGWRKALEDISA
jgi:formimidoylglutamate deiminase